MQSWFFSPAVLPYRLTVNNFAIKTQNKAIY